MPAARRAALCWLEARRAGEFILRIGDAEPRAQRPSAATTRSCGRWTGWAWTTTKARSRTPRLDRWLKEVTPSRLVAVRPPPATTPTPARRTRSARRRSRRAKAALQRHAYRDASARSWRDDPNRGHPASGIQPDGVGGLGRTRPGRASGSANSRAGRPGDLPQRRLRPQLHAVVVDDSTCITDVVRGDYVNHPRQIHIWALGAAVPISPPCSSVSTGTRAHRRPVRVMSTATWGAARAELSGRLGWSHGVKVRSRK